MRRPTQMDNSLCGRWRSTDRSILELSDTGTVANINFKVWLDPINNLDSISWEASNGQLRFNSKFDYVYEWSIEKDQELMLMY